MRKLWLGLLLVAGCVDKDDTDTGPAEADADADADADTDTDTDTDTDVESESDCSDGEDNDSDGLVDCEDEDCLDVCPEDCGDGEDNDNDGLIDCDDDECYGVGSCGGPYAMSMSLSFDYLEMYYTHEYYYPSGTTISQTAYMAANRGSRNTGLVELSATPSGWDGDDFSCTGEFTFFVGYNLPRAHPYYDAYFGASALVLPGNRFEFDMALAEADSSLSWDSACPVSALPVMPLSHPFDSGDLYFGGGPRYTTKLYDYTTGAIVGSDSILSFSYNNMFDLTSASPYTWTGRY